MVRAGGGIARDGNTAGGGVGRGLAAGMKLEQGQIWKQGDVYYRIVVWERLAIEYKVLADVESKEGTRHKVTKKEFCRLIKGGELLTGREGRESREGLPESLA